MIAMLKNLFATVQKAGKGYVTLYLVLILIIPISVLNIVFGIVSDPKVERVLDTSILLFISALLYIELDKKGNSGDISTLQDSGILFCSKVLEGDAFRELMSTPGEIRVVNTWIYNVNELTNYFREALIADETNIEISYLSPDSEFVWHRAEELKLKAPAVKRNIDTSKQDLAFFLKNLGPDQLSRIRVYEYNVMPRVILHTNGDRGYLGFFWPKQNAVQSPQLYFEGLHKTISSKVWSQYEFIVEHRIDVTERLVSLD